MSGRLSSSTMSGPRKALAFVGLGLLGSQAGHLLAYQLRFGAADLLLWGTLGQLPIAAAAALAVGWLSARVESAVGAIRDAVGATATFVPLPAPLVVAANAAAGCALLMSRMVGSSLAKRGPPS